MRVRSEGWNIVLAGFWNRLIFTPEWVRERLFATQEIETYVALLPVLPVVFKSPSVSLEVVLARLLFRPKNVANDKDFLQAESMARAVLNALPETPIQAVGINYSFVEDFPPGHLTSVFNDNDPTELGTFGWSIKERKLIRQLSQGPDTLNLTLTYDGKAATFDLNYHTEATNSQAGLLAINEGRVSTLKKQSLDLLMNAYHLEFEEDGDDDNS